MPQCLSLALCLLAGPAQGAKAHGGHVDGARLEAGEVGPALTSQLHLTSPNIPCVQPGESPA